MWYGSAPPPSTLGAAVANIHRDPGWWGKIAVGGALMLSVIGYPLVAGYELEYIDQCRQGYASPLARWADWSTKALLGLFGIAIDFYFFVWPLLIGGLVSLCSILGVSYMATGSNPWPGRTLLGLLIGYLCLVWASGADIVAKQSYVAGAEMADVLRLGLVRRGLVPPGLRTKVGTRLWSTPAYLAAIGIFIAAASASSLPTWVQLIGFWLGSMVLFYARLVTIQLYWGASQAQELHSQRTG
ncbi:MAG: DUF4013 domain-containing protein [Herpetosiphon sp.]